jgi:hypothetical protein
MSSSFYFVPAHVRDTALPVNHHKAINDVVSGQEPVSKVRVVHHGRELEFAQVGIEQFARGGHVGGHHCSDACSTV